MEYVLYGMELVLVMLILELYVNMDDNNYNDMYAGLEYSLSIIISDAGRICILNMLIINLLNMLWYYFLMVYVVHILYVLLYRISFI